jgi:hypothetical protein
MDVEELELSKQSLMPDNVISQLTFEQFIDLVAFLRDRPAQESLRTLALEVWAAGPFGENLKQEFGPEKRPDPKATYEGGKIAWQPLTGDPKGYFDLKAAYGKDHASAYALTNVYSPKDQTVTMWIGSKDGIRVWVNDKVVHESETSRAARADEDKIAVKLNSGWNRVLVKVVNETGAHGFYLRFSGGDGIRVSMNPEGK